jgi:hypothetical protein
VPIGQPVYEPDHKPQGERGHELMILELPIPGVKAKLPDHYYRAEHEHHERQIALYVEIGFGNL